jgi:peptide/nickel transport system substrate-binding protein
MKSRCNGVPARVSRVAVVGLVLALAGAGLVGCGGGEPTAAPAAPTAAAAGALPTSAPEEVESAALIFAHPADAGKLDPSDVTDGESLLVNWHLYEGLTRYKAGSTEVEPALATDWSASEDGLEWTFTLRDGVTFHDGTDFDADAVVWNFNRWFDKANPSHFPDWDFTYWGDMFQGFKGDDADADGTPDGFFEAAEATGPLTVTLKLTRPNAPLLQTLAMGNFGFSSPAGVEKSGSSYGTPDGDPMAAGTGPYRVKDWVVNDHITLEANPDYWGDAPASPAIVFRVIPDGTARFLSLSSGEIDGMNQANPEDIETASGDANLKVVFEPANNVAYLGFNQAHAPWGNLNCRLAVAHAIDKQGLIASLYGDGAEAAVQMMPPEMWGYNSTLQDYPFDMTLAKEFLDKCAAEETLPEEVVFYVPPVQRFYMPKPKELGEAIQAALAELGIKTSIQSPDWASVYLPDVRSGKADIYLLGWGGDNGDPDNYLCVFFCGGTASFNSDAEGNPLPPDAELNTLLREAATLSDQAARQTLYEQANARVHDLVLAVPIAHRSAPILFRSNVSGYVPSPIQVRLETTAKQ